MSGARATKPQPALDNEDEDEWDRRIRRTGCFAENEAVLICHADSNDWRKCLRELDAFKKCMQAHNNAQPNPK